MTKQTKRMESLFQVRTDKQIPELMVWNSPEDNATTFINLLIDCYEENNISVDWRIIGALTTKLRNIREKK